MSHRVVITTCHCSNGIQMELFIASLQLSSTETHTFWILPNILFKTSFFEYF